MQIKPSGDFFAFFYSDMKKHKYIKLCIINKWVGWFTTVGLFLWSYLDDKPLGILWSALFRGIIAEGTQLPGISIKSEALFISKSKHKQYCQYEMFEQGFTGNLYLLSVGRDNLPQSWVLLSSSPQRPKT
mgnify:CR=1 FL=1